MSQDIPLPVPLPDEDSSVSEDNFFDVTTSQFRDLVNFTPQPTPPPAPQPIFESYPPPDTSAYTFVPAPDTNLVMPLYSSNSSHSSVIAPPRSTLPNVQITLDNCLLMRVMRHIQAYDGTICSNPTRVTCGAPDYFRQNYCERKDPRCFDYSLYGADQYMVRKPRNDEYEEFLSQVVPGNIMLFWTNRATFNYLVGAYVVDKIEARDGREGIGLISQPYYRIEGNRELSVRFVEGLIDSSPVWNRSVRSEVYSKFIRKLERSAVIQSLQMMRDKHEAKAAELRTAARLPEAEQCANVMRRLDMIIKLAVDQSITSSGTTSYPTYSSPSPAAALNSPTVPTAVASSLITRRTTPTANGKNAGTDVTRIMDYLRQEKLYYPEDLVWRYHISLMSKPFVILTGVSGGGKTQLTRVYAEAINNNKSSNNYCLVSVRPDWNNNESLLGSYDVLNRRFVPTVFCEFVQRAVNEWRAKGRSAKKYFVCLDEMNLARAEYYFSDFLSRMEVDGEDLRKIRLYDALPTGDDEMGQDLYIPPNLYITGTVNLDETTHTFSRKVLDRANIIKVDRIDITHMLDLLRSDYPPDMLDFVGQHLREINFRLAEAGQQFGYRTVREILDWVQQAVESGYFTVAQALDIQIMQKVLVKIEVSGDHTRQTSMLDKLTSYFEQEAREDDVPIFERSSETINALVARLSEDDIVIGQL